MINSAAAPSLQQDTIDCFFDVLDVIEDHHRPADDAKQKLFRIWSRMCAHEEGLLEATLEEFKNRTL